MRLKGATMYNNQIVQEMDDALDKALYSQAEYYVLRAAESISDHTDVDLDSALKFVTIKLIRDIKLGKLKPYFPEE